eukprot:219311_1
MKAVAALLLGLSYVNGASWDQEHTSETFAAQDSKAMFEEWSTAFDREYDSLEEEAYRYGLWVGAMNQITESNDQDLTFKLRMNQFGDLTDDEFKIRIHGHKDSCLQ